VKLNIHKQIIPVILLFKKFLASIGIFPLRNTPRYVWTHWQAYQACAQRGATLVSLAEIWEVQRNGYGIRVS